MRTIEISKDVWGEDENETRRFYDGLQTDECLLIQCAYKLSSPCSPDCSACHQRGAKFVCVRNGVENEFEIGYSN